MSPVKFQGRWGSFSGHRSAPAGVLPTGPEDLKWGSCGKHLALMVREEMPSPQFTENWGSEKG